MIIDALQYNNWSEKIFNQLREGGVTAVHVTITYHEDFRETVENIIAWNRRFEQFPDHIRPAGSAEEVQAAAKENRTAILFGCQNCSPIEDDIGLVEILHGLGIRFMQLSYNNQSLLATGCYENEDPGITRMGKQVIGEMNRVGMVVDMSHSAERSTLEAIEISERPIAITQSFVLASCITKQIGTGPKRTFQKQGDARILNVSSPSQRQIGMHPGKFL